MDINSVLKKDGDEKRTYIREQYSKQIKAPMHDYLRACYENVNKNQRFYEKEKQLMKKDGILSFILLITMLVGVYLGLKFGPDSSSSGALFEGLFHALATVMSVFLGVVVSVMTVVGIMLLHEKMTGNTQIRGLKNERDEMFNELLQEMENKPLNVEYSTVSQLEKIYILIINSDIISNYLITNLKNKQQEEETKEEKAQRLKTVEILEKRPYFSLLKVADKYWLFKFISDKMSLPYEIKLLMLSDL